MSRIPKLNFWGEIGGLLEGEARKMGKEGIWNRGGRRGKWEKKGYGIGEGMEGKRE